MCDDDAVAEFDAPVPPEGTLTSAPPPRPFGDAGGRNEDDDLVAAMATVAATACNSCVRSNSPMRPTVSGRLRVLSMNCWLYADRKGVWGGATTGSSVQRA